MSDALWAARLGDALNHTSMMADILGGVLEVAANIAITVVTGGVGCFVLGLVVGTIVGLTMSKTRADKGLSNLCESFSNALFPPTVQANILTGSTNNVTIGGGSMVVREIRTGKTPGVGLAVSALLAQQQVSSLQSSPRKKTVSGRIRTKSSTGRLC